ncbi:uncharacterized protein LOC113763933 isoform X1 [Coffea eugenioides]|uniref:uncharacterized protein LOC113763933 isoform X1 n=1 Tax=Coffea eugenioides TaxID=49369 RepID=UPI000F6068EB|nr:uncharacterized protein LOC113763933 isoform X1 [Coffea eugenioides]
MGKLSQQQLPVARQQQQRQGSTEEGGVGSSIFCCRRCSAAFNRIARDCGCKCVFVLLLSVAVFVYALFSVVHLSSKEIGYDAKDAIKIRATVQAYLRLQKPVAQLLPHINELEYDIFGEIGVPSTKVAVLSMHRAGLSNITDVVFGVLSDPLSVPINPVFLSVLKSSFVELFLLQSNLTLTNTTFGEPSSFEILKFPGGITLIPEQSPSIWSVPQILFNFTLNNSIYEIREKFVELKTQLKLGLDLMPDEIVYIQVTNNNGSTRDPPVVVEASITSNWGILLPQRMRQLAKKLMGSPKNLGLDMYVFGKVKEVSLSSSLKHSLDILPPTPSPSPSPSPDLPFYGSDPPAPAPNFPLSAPCSNFDVYAPSDPSPENDLDYFSAPLPAENGPKCRSGLSPSYSPVSHAHPPSPNISPSASTPSTGSIAQTGPSPLPVVSFGSGRGWENENGRRLVSPPHSLPSISASSMYPALSSPYHIWWVCLFGLFIFHLLSYPF